MVERWTVVPMVAGSSPAPEIYETHPWCSGNILAFQACASGSIPEGCIIMIKMNIFKVKY